MLGRHDYDPLLAEVEGTEIDDLLFLPYLMGERSPVNDPSAKGIFYGLTLSKGRPAMTRAVLEGVCFALRDCYAVIQEQGIRPAFARVIGGGSRSPVWLQILSDVLGLELRTINTHDGGALGARPAGHDRLRPFSQCGRGRQSGYSGCSVFLSRLSAAP